MTLTLGYMSGRACQAELSARVRQDQSPSEATLSPPFLSAGKKSNSLALDQVKGGGQEALSSNQWALHGCYNGYSVSRAAHLRQEMHYLGEWMASVRAYVSWLSTVL